MKNSFIIYLSIILFPLTACDPDSVGKEQFQKSYRIELGEDIFNVPTEYLLHAKNRKDGPQDYVITVAKIPELTPIDGALSYNRPPDSTEDTISFDLNYYNGKKVVSNALLLHWAANRKNSTVVIPDKYTKEGLIHLGTNKPGGKWVEDVYAIVKNGTPVAQLTCSQPREGTVPSCRVYQRYRDHMGMIVDFRIGQLKWYASEGMQKVLDKVDSWDQNKEKAQ